ncbi:MAG: DMT family transporter [Candidatus Eisenbacteria bacterium]
MRTDPSRTSPTLLVVIGAIIISFSPVFVRVADVGPMTAGFYRTFFGALALLAYVAVRRERLWRGLAPFGFAAAGGLLFALDLRLWHQSIHYVGPGLATILGNFQAFVLAAYGIIVHRERPGLRFAVSLPLALLGLFLLVGVNWSALPAEARIGVVLGLCTAFAYASYVIVYQRSQRRPVRTSPAATLTTISLVTAAAMGIGALTEGESLRLTGGPTLLSMVGYGVLCQALGWILISQGLPAIPTFRAGLILLLQPTLSFVWDILFFGRPTGWTEWLGAGLALGAIYMGTTRPPRRRRG